MLKLFNILLNRFGLELIRRPKPIVGYTQQGNVVRLLNKRQFRASMSGSASMTTPSDGQKRANVGVNEE